MTLLLIALNCLVFFREVKLGPLAEQFIAEYAAYPDAIASFSLWTPAGRNALLGLITSMFLHGGWAHLLGNVWFLWIFGDNVEDFLGHVRYLLFYLVTGVCAGLTHVYFNSSSSVPMIGASGAISGILGGYLILHPRIRIRTLLFFGFFVKLVHVPALFFLGVWFLMQFLGNMGGGDAGVAFAAHLGGFVAGMAVLLVVSSRSERERTRQRAVVRD